MIRPILPMTVHNVARDQQLMRSLNAVQADQNVAQEWQAYTDGRAYSAWPQGWQVTGPRPNACNERD